jgi:hypothetical protein
MTLEDIAAWCDCPASTIQRIEKRALKKAWWHPQNPRLRRAILEAMRAHTPPGKAAKPFKLSPAIWADRHLREAS